MRDIFGIVAWVGLGVMASMATYAHSAAKTPVGPTGRSSEAFLHSIYDRYVGPQDKAQPIDYSKPSELRHYFDLRSPEAYTRISSVLRRPTMCRRSMAIL